MKAKIPTIESMIKSEVRKQFYQKRSEMYEDCSQDVSRQVLALCLFYLDKTYGFRKKRLNDTLQGICDLITIKPFNSTVSTAEIEAYIKSTYDIDLSKIKISFEDRIGENHHEV